MPGSKLEIKLICCSLTVLHNVPLPLDGQALKLIGPQIIKEIRVHCGKLERKNLMLCWQPLLILWCFLQVFFFFACLLYFISWLSVHHQLCILPMWQFCILALTYWSHMLLPSDGRKIFRRPVFCVGSLRHSQDQTPVTLCKLFTTVGLRRAFLCFAMGSWKRAMFIKSKAKSILNESLRNGGGQPSEWNGCDPKIIQREGESFIFP